MPEIDFSAFMGSAGGALAAFVAVEVRLRWIWWRCNRIERRVEKLEEKAA